MRRLVLAIALLASCGKPEDPPPRASKPPPELPPLPDYGPAEDFARDDFLELAPGGSTAFGWDLSQDTHHFYSYEQDSKIEAVVSGQNEKATLVYRTPVKGNAEVIGGGSGGELNFLAAPLSQTVNGQPISSEELNKLPKSIVQYMLRPDGAIVSRVIRSGMEDPKIELFFALPSKELKPGERDTREVHLTYYRDDSKYHGKQEFTHAGRRKVGRYECVKLLSRVDLEAVPPEDGTGRLQGWIAAYVAPKEKKFVRVDASLALAVNVRREVRPADPKAEAWWHLTTGKADMKVTILLKD